MKIEKREKTFQVSMYNVDDIISEIRNKTDRMTPPPAKARGFS
jgi:hypothetical protein